MKNIRLVVTLLQLSALSTLALAEPEWVRNLGKSSAHPPDSYLTGYGMSPDGTTMSTSEKLAYARNAAAGNLAASMQVNVSSEDIVDRFSRVVNDNEELVDQYKSRTVLKSSLKLDGLRFEEHAERKSGPAHALAILDRAEAAQHYRRKFSGKMSQLVQHQQEGNRLLTGQQVELARQAYADCNRLVGELEEIILIQELLGERASVSATDGARPSSPSVSSRSTTSATTVASIAKRPSIESGTAPAR